MSWPNGYERWRNEADYDHHLDPNHHLPCSCADCVGRRAGEGVGMSERKFYHGEVFHNSGEDFLAVDSYAGGYAPIVMLSVQFTHGSMSLGMTGDDARELARHLLAAVDALP